MKEDGAQCFNLSEARNLIAKAASKKKLEEVVTLRDVLGRVPSKPLLAKEPKPAFDQSTRDGYVFPEGGGQRVEGGIWYAIAGEIPAGSTAVITLEKGVAYRIMTGGMVPDNSLRVIAQEECVVENGQVFIADNLLKNHPTCIRRTGCVFQVGDRVVKAGEPIFVDQLALLAETGHDKIVVHSRPRVSYFCSGSELVANPSEIRKGLKLSTNRFILDGVLKDFGCITTDLGGVADNVEAVTFLLKTIDSGEYDVVVSTGGMGPGKYDFMKEAFVRAGGEIIYSSLKVRPGKSTLFGLLGKTLFFALPGPPPAVRTLLNELLRPALLAMQGIAMHHPRKIQAKLLEPITLKKSGILNLKAGVLSINGSQFSIRGCGKLESPTGYMLLGEGKRSFFEGDLVDVHLLDSPLYSFL